MTLASKGVKGVDEALAILDLAAARAPTDVQVQSERIELVVNYKKWQAAERSLEGLKQALYKAAGTATGAHVWAARIAGELGRWTNALGEYRIALADTPNDVALWMRVRAGGDVRRTRQNGARGARPGGAPQPQQSRDHRCPAGGQRAPGALAGERGMSGTLIKSR